MNDGQKQNVKDILEDIKRAISDKNTEAETEDDEDVLHLEDEYLEDTEESNEEEHYEDKENEETAVSNGKLNGHSYDLKKDIGLHNNTQVKQVQDNDQLILKENMEGIKALLGKMQNELQQQQKQQQKRQELTVEELVISLLKPQLSEWLNKYLYGLVKEVVEKELKDIINKNK
ncbi:DUF2497 domain-containing protein [Wolbachia endosymbiont of Ctenocephalides felis wCfeT]|uniref:DUF2497 domain-containing protein n=1 Tax=Wolbachia endosymbiont of Ctenocephalides felis wCfeT TaxID=2732593 RepID=UPI00144582B4|nr:DUF2497 domain-containing protein [Wolbachia endosymbiont of Ctenocephalides felis wCfeT]